MGGAHAFNYPDKEIYWKDQTVRYHHQFATEALGIPSEEVIYKEGVWVGGGNAGPDVECIVRGLEVGTLVFMQYKVVGDEFVELPIRTVDTGYGIDRFAWISQGVPSCFQAIYGDLLDKVYAMAGITNVDNEFLARVAKYSGLVNVDKTANRMVLPKTRFATDRHRHGNTGKRAYSNRERLGSLPTTPKPCASCSPKALSHPTSKKATWHGCCSAELTA